MLKIQNKQKKSSKDSNILYFPFSNTDLQINLWWQKESRITKLTTVEKLNASVF